MRTLLTGAGGYLGLHILRELLQDGQQVTAVVRSPGKLGSFAQDPRVTIVEADLEDASRIARMLPGHDVFIHAALIWGAPGSELEVRDTAVTAKLFHFAGGARVKRCIYLSSAAVHRPFSTEMREEDSLSTADLYGATKAAGELFLRAACAKYQMTGIALRPGPMVGLPALETGTLRTPDRIAEMVAAAAKGHPIEVVRGEGRQFTDVSAMARIVCLLTRAENTHATYICVDRDFLTWEQIARNVVEGLSSQSEVRVLPREAAMAIARFRTDRIEGLLGGPMNAEGALLAHIRRLTRPDP